MANLHNYFEILVFPTLNIAFWNIVYSISFQLSVNVHTQFEVAVPI